MSEFIGLEDYERKIRSYRLDQIIDDNEQILAQAELDAIQEVSDYLYQFYDVDIIFAQTGEDRHKSVLRWCKDVVMYRIYDRIDDELVPDRVIKNYDNTILVLKKISGGAMPIDLPRKTEAEDNTITRFRGGSEPARSH